MSVSRDVSAPRWTFRRSSARFRRSSIAIPPCERRLPVRSGAPVQQIHDHEVVNFEEIDASSWDRDELHSRLGEVAQRPFDLEHGPMMRVNLFARSRMRTHPAAGRSSYRGRFLVARGDPPRAGRTLRGGKDRSTGRASSLALHYTDFVHWQAEMLASPAGERLWDYWKQQLGGPLPVLNLPTDRPRPPMQSFRGAQHDFTLNADLAGGSGRSPKPRGRHCMWSCWRRSKLMLYHHSGQEDILVASPMVGRSRAEFEGIVAFCQSGRLARRSLRKPTFRAFLGQVRQTVWRRSKIRIIPHCVWSSGSGRRGISAGRRSARPCSSWISPTGSPNRPPGLRAGRDRAAR